MKTPSRTVSRKRAYRKGKLSEWLAAAALFFKGYRIVEMRYRTKVGEIDIIARKGPLIIFAEVKARPTIEDAINAVSFESRRRIQNAGDIWLTKQNNVAGLSIRFDIIAVRPYKWPVHFKDAF